MPTFTIRSDRHALCMTGAQPVWFDDLSDAFLQALEDCPHACGDVYGPLDAPGVLPAGGVVPGRRDPRTGLELLPRITGREPFSD